MPRPRDLTDLSVSGPVPDDLLSSVLGTVRLAGEMEDAVVLGPGETLDAERLSSLCLFATTVGTAELDNGADRVVVAAGELVLPPDGTEAGGLGAGPDGARLLLARFGFDTRRLRGIVLVLPRLIPLPAPMGRRGGTGSCDFWGSRRKTTSPARR